MKVKHLLSAGFGALAMVGALTLSASSLPVYTVTGTVELKIDGKTQVYEATTNTVPNQPGFLVHTATWRIMDPIMMGGINLAPDDILVHLVANTRDNKDVNSRLAISFTVDKEVYKLSTTSTPQVNLDLPVKGETITYLDEQAVVVLDSSELDSSEVLHVKGTVTGVLEPQFSKKNGPKLNYEARFDVQLPRH